MPAIPATFAGCAAAQLRAIRPPRLRAKNTGRSGNPRFFLTSVRKVSNTRFPLGLPYDSPASTPATQRPAARKRSNIQRSSGPGSDGRVGVYQTHPPVTGVPTGGRIRKASCPATVKTSPGSGRDFAGPSPTTRNAMPPTNPRRSSRRSTAERHPGVCGQESIWMGITLI